MGPAASITAHVSSFLGGSIAWGLVLGVATAIAMLATGGIPTDPAGVDMTAMGGTVTGGLTIAQMAGFGAWALFLAATLPARGASSAFATPSLQHLSAHLGLVRDVPWRLVGLALVGSLTVWTFPSWLAQLLLEWSGQDQSSLLMIAELLRTGSVLDRGVMVAAIVLSAPLFEELIFRGYLWEVVERWAGAGAALVLTTLLFALYHLDPVHVLSLLPTAAFLGYLRWATGSVWAPLAAHFGNNAVSAVLVLAQSGDSTEELPLAVALVGAAWTLICCIVAWVLSQGPRRAS